MKPTKFPLNIGEVLIKAMTFRALEDTRSHSRYVLCDLENREQFRETHKNFISGVYLEDTWETSKWFVFYVADCFSPPFYLIRAESWEAAYEAFCDEFSDAMKIEETDLADYGENFSISASGVPIDTESVQGFEVLPVNIIC